MKRTIALFVIISVLALCGCNSNNHDTVVDTVIDLTSVSSVSETVTSVTESTSGTSSETTEKQSFKNEYGVFLSFEGKLDKLADYHTVVIDAQYYGKEEIEAFKGEGHKVLSYINIGSLEDFRSYYKRFKSLKLGRYENWDEEIWIDVSDSNWQAFITEELIPDLTAKGIDGFFVDNCDVYYNYPREDILTGLSNMMIAMRKTGLQVLINGGDKYLDAYCKTGGSWDDVISGINQENVFAKILWDKNGFGRADPEDHEYFKDYIERYADKGADIYLLEYTKDQELISEIKEYCESKGFSYYVSDSVELD